MVVLVAAPTAAAAQPSKAYLVWLPPQTSVSQLAAAGLSPGLLSAGLGTVPVEQTYLDIGQGNRVFDSLYDGDIPESEGACPPWWEAVVERADSAPAEIVPGRLVESLLPKHIGVNVSGESACGVAGFADEGRGPASRGILEVADLQLPRVDSLARSLDKDDLLIAVAKPTGETDDLLPIGIASGGFEGNLTSGSTRMDGYVLSTDVAPTILEHFGLDLPSEMSGQPIESDGSVDPSAVEKLGARLGVISHRRGPVIGWSLLVWLGLLALTVAATRGRAARPAVRLTGLAVVYMPLAMLAAAAIEPAQSAEVLLVLLGAPVLGAVTLALLRGYRALAAAAALTVLAYALDVIVGSPLTALSLLGPNPGLGVRFYGIGNELEALLVVLVVAGSGAGLAGFAPRLSARRCAAAFLAIGLFSAFVFAAGRFGADVGAAIVFPVGAAVAAAAIAARRRRAALLVIAAPLAVVALLALVDLVTGANAHLTRSVLDAGGLGDLSDVAQRRLQLSAKSFGRPVLLAFLPLVALLVALAVWRRDRLREWVKDAPAMRAGLLGAVAATAVGTLANDSGALLLEVGTAYLLVFVGFAWAERPAIAQTKSYNSARHESDISP